MSHCFLICRFTRPHKISVLGANVKVHRIHQVLGMDDSIMHVNTLFQLSNPSHVRHPSEIIIVSSSGSTCPPIHGSSVSALRLWTLAGCAWASSSRHLLWDENDEKWCYEESYDDLLVRGGPRLTPPTPSLFAQAVQHRLLHLCRTDYCLSFFVCSLLHSGNNLIIK